MGERTRATRGVGQSVVWLTDRGRLGWGVGEKHTLGLADGSVDDLEDRDGECRGFTGTRLSLGDGVAAFAYLDDSTRLHSRRGLVAICVNSTEEVFCARRVSKGIATGIRLGRYP